MPLRALIVAGRMLIESSGGYSFTDETRELVEHHLDCIRRAIAEGTTQFRRGDLDAEVEALRAAARASDPDFAQFLGRLADD